MVFYTNLQWTLSVKSDKKKIYIRITELKTAMQTFSFDYGLIK